MPKPSLTNFFIASVLKDPSINLLVYADPNFANAVQLTAINEINVILAKINSEHLYSRDSKGNFNLNLVVNTPHPQSGLHLLDYCLVAGFHELAIRFAYSGAVCKSNATFIQNIITTFSDGVNMPEIVNDIYATYDKVSYIKLSQRKLSVDGLEHKNTWQRVKSIVNDHPFAALLFSVGATCSIVSPLVSGYGTALLLSIGVPSLLASVNSMQNSKGGKDSKQQSLIHDKIAYEAKEIKNWLEMAKEIKHELQLSVHKKANIRMSVSADNASTVAVDSPNILFMYEPNGIQVNDCVLEPQYKISGSKF